MGTIQREERREETRKKVKMKVMGFVVKGGWRGGKVDEVEDERTLIQRG